MVIRLLVHAADDAVKLDHVFGEWFLDFCQHVLNSLLIIRWKQCNPQLLPVLKDSINARHDDRVALNFIPAQRDELLRLA